MSAQIVPIPQEATNNSPSLIKMPCVLCCAPPFLGGGSRSLPQSNPKGSNVESFTAALHFLRSKSLSFPSCPPESPRPVAAERLGLLTFSGIRPLWFSHWKTGDRKKSTFQRCFQFRPSNFRVPERLTNMLFLEKVWVFVLEDYGHHKFISIYSSLLLFLL